MSTPSPSERLHQLLERLQSVFRESLRDVAGTHGLKLVQLEALIYLAGANRYSDVPGALAEYLGVTKGTVSQTVLALERQGLIEKHPDPKDRRVVHCRPTAAGAKLARGATPAPLLSRLPATEAEAQVQALEGLLRALQTERGFRPFGVCRTCVHHEPTGTGARCGLTGEALAPDETSRLCREHARPDAASPR